MTATCSFIPITAADFLTIRHVCVVKTLGKCVCHAGVRMRTMLPARSGPPPHWQWPSTVEVCHDRGT